MRADNPGLTSAPSAMTGSANTRLALQISYTALFALAAIVPLAHAQAGPQKLPTIKLRAGMHMLTVEVAETPEEHQIGLMFRESMATNDGMIFVFEQPGRQCFWMKNTLLPLAVAFVDDDGSITNIENMLPQTLENHCSTKEVRYVVEMNKDWFAKRGIKAGSKLQGGPFKGW